MNKLSFLDELYHLLKSLPSAERQQHLDYYAEMIDDRVEDGLSEEASVAALGSAADIAAQILGDIPQKKMRRYPVWATVLTVLGSPLWITLLLAAAAVVLSIVLSLAAVYISVFVTLWALLAALYITDLALALSFLACTAGGVFYLAQGIGIAAPSLLFFGTGLVCAGCTVLLFFLCNWLFRLLWRLNKWSAMKIAGIFRRKGGKK